MNLLPKLILGLVLGGVAAIAAYFFIQMRISGEGVHFMKANACLRRGGCWDRVDRLCRMEPEATELCKRKP
jgi:hypothetical protein